MPDVIELLILMCNFLKLWDDKKVLVTVCPLGDITSQLEKLAHRVVNSDCALIIEKRTADNRTIESASFILAVGHIPEPAWEYAHELLGDEFVLFPDLPEDDAEMFGSCLLSYWFNTARQ